MKYQPIISECRKILYLAVPLIIANIAMIGMGVIDTIMAGQASTDDLAGLAVGGNIWIFIEIGMGGLITAITPRVARFYGAKQFSDITIEIQQGLLLGIFIGILGMIMMLFIIPYLPLLGTTDGVTKVAQGYTQVIAFSLPASAVIWVLFCLWEGHGLLRFAVISSVVSLIFNLILDYIFVFGKLGFPALGGIGCSWTTTIIYWGWGISCVLYSAWHTDFKRYQIFKQWPAINWSRWRAILALGLPISLALLAEEGFFNVATLLIAPLGTEAIGAHQITIQIVALVLMLGLGIGQATAIRVAQSIGRADLSSLDRQIKTGLTLVVFIGLLVGMIVFTFRAYLPGLFTENIAIIAISSAIMLFAPIYLLTDVLQVFAAQALRGFEDTKIPMMIQITAYWIIGFPLGYSLGLTTLWGERYGIYGFWVGFLVGILIGSCLLCIRLYKRVHRYNLQPHYRPH